MLEEQGEGEGARVDSGVFSEMAFVFLVCDSASDTTITGLGDR